MHSLFVYGIQKPKYMICDNATAMAEVFCGTFMKHLWKAIPLPDDADCLQNGKKSV